MKRIERVEREERKETRIERDVKTFVGWSYIEKIVEQSDHPELVVGIFLTGGRASEILDLTGGMFTEFEDYYEVVGMPVYKRYDVVEKYIDSFGKRRWKTQLVMERRTFPILKTEEFSELLWKYTRKNEGKLFEFKDRHGRLWKDQYWQLYKRIHNLKVPKNPYAPEKLYPHWLRGQRAAQLRVEYNLDIDKLMRFFGWESYATAQHYAGMSSRDIAEAMILGKGRRRMGRQPKENSLLISTGEDAAAESAVETIKKAFGEADDSSPTLKAEKKVKIARLEPVEKEIEKILKGGG